MSLAKYIAEKKLTIENLTKACVAKHGYVPSQDLVVESDLENLQHEAQELRRLIRDKDLGRTIDRMAEYYSEMCTMYVQTQLEGNGGCQYYAKEMMTECKSEMAELRKIMKGEEV